MPNSPIILVHTYVNHRSYLRRLHTITYADYIYEETMTSPLSSSRSQLQTPRALSLRCHRDHNHNRPYAYVAHMNTSVRGHSCIDRCIAHTGFGILKKCAAMYNISKGKLDKSIGEAIIQAADEVWCVRRAPDRGRN